MPLLSDQRVTGGNEENVIMEKKFGIPQISHALSMFHKYHKPLNQIKSTLTDISLKNIWYLFSSLGDINTSMNLEFLFFGLFENVWCV